MVSGAESDLLCLLPVAGPVEEDGLDTDHRHDQAGHDHCQQHQGQRQAVGGEGGDVQLGDRLVWKDNFLV